MHCSVIKMDKEQEQTLAEQEALLAECKLYKGEKEPENKEPLTQDDEEETVTGLPVGPTPTSTDVGVPVPPTPWSTGLFQCFGTGDEHFSSDLEVCEYLFFNFEIFRLLPGLSQFSELVEAKFCL